MLAVMLPGNRAPSLPLRYGHHRRAPHNILVRIVTPNVRILNSAERSEHDFSPPNVRQFA
jgi:hypothetical protein